MKYKIGYVTENRKEEGLILEDNVSNNIALTVLNRFKGKLNKINYKRQDEAVQDMIDRLKLNPIK
jgi:ribose transport system ATP-binding protein